MSRHRGVMQDRKEVAGRSHQLRDSLISPRQLPPGSSVIKDRPTNWLPSSGQINLDLSPFGEVIAALWLIRLERTCVLWPTITGLMTLLLSIENLWAISALRFWWG